MRKNLDLYMNKPDTKVVILTLTNSCNLSCSYCYESHKDARTMRYDTAIEIIEKEMGADDATRFVCLYYFGGEPFLEFDTIRRIHAYMQGKMWPKGWFAFTTTNGTLIHGEIQDWLRENADTIEVFLSVDGSSEMQNRNRSDSYSQIDLAYFRDEYPFAKMTVTPETLPELASGVIELHERGFEVSANLGYGVNWSEDCPEILTGQLSALMDYYLAHPHTKPATMMNLAIMDINPVSQVLKRFCVWMG